MPDVKKREEGGENTKMYSLVAYVLGWLTGVVMFLLAKDDKTIKFHAVQSILLNVVVIVAYVILLVLTGVIGVVLATVGVPGFCCMPITILVPVVGWLYGLYVGYNAYSGKDMKMKIPVIGNFAEQFAG